MSKTFERIKQLVATRSVRISEHGYDEPAADDILARDIVSGIGEGLVVELSGLPKGVCVLILQKDRTGNPVHVVWGIPKRQAEPAVVVTAFRPDPAQWEDGYKRRRV